MIIGTSSIIARARHQPRRVGRDHRDAELVRRPGHLDQRRPEPGRSAVGRDPVSRRPQRSRPTAGPLLATSSRSTSATCTMRANGVTSTTIAVSDERLPSRRQPRRCAKAGASDRRRRRGGRARLRRAPRRSPTSSSTARRRVGRSDRVRRHALHGRRRLRGAQGRRCSTRPAATSCCYLPYTTFHEIAPGPIDGLAALCRAGRHRRAGQRRRSTACCSGCTGRARSTSRTDNQAQIQGFNSVLRHRRDRPDRDRRRRAVWSPASAS